MNNRMLAIAATILIGSAIAAATNIGPPDPIISPRKGVNYTSETPITPGDAFTITISSNNPSCSTASEGVVSCGTVVDGIAQTSFGGAFENDTGSPITQLFYLFRAFNSAGQLVDLPQNSFGVDTESIFNALTVISPFEAELFSTVEASIPPGGDFTNFLGDVLVPAGGSVGITGSSTPIPEPASLGLMLPGLLGLGLVWKRKARRKAR
jgi:hypothetical protein